MLCDPGAANDNPHSRAVCRRPWALSKLQRLLWLLLRAQLRPLLGLPRVVHEARDVQRRWQWFRYTCWPPWRLLRGVPLCRLALELGLSLLLAFNGDVALGTVNLGTGVATMAWLASTMTIRFRVVLQPQRVIFVGASWIERHCAAYNDARCGCW
eukprot:TRINITY_DN11208_c0_g6_i1.p1 TRINITY_DN11208_c0_g6~~TRINITY_DN11208_c0_g6_i1.p1  ORF type:complete len:155 (-),score=7.27 TRINITY_DN11208_c0_g6_i1:148-612(-)